MAEVAGSGWVRELLTADPGEPWGRWVIRHFMIFIHGAGCYEVATESWSWLAKEEGLP